MTETETLLPSKAVMEHFHIKSRRTLRAWETDERLNFPKPIVLPGGRKVWRGWEIAEWEAQRQGSQESA